MAYYGSSLYDESIAYEESLENENDLNVKIDFEDFVESYEDGSQEHDLQSLYFFRTLKFRPSKIQSLNLKKRHHHILMPK